MASQCHAKWTNRGTTSKSRILCDGTRLWRNTGRMILAVGTTTDLRVRRRRGFGLIKESGKTSILLPSFRYRPVVHQLQTLPMAMIGETR